MAAASARREGVRHGCEIFWREREARKLAEHCFDWSRNIHPRLSLLSAPARRNRIVALEDDLFGIEERLWLGGADDFRAHLDRFCLLTFPLPDKMHGVFSRDEIARTAEPPRRWHDLKMSERHLLAPVDGIAVISYRAEARRHDGGAYAALVSSAYLRRTDGWKLAFHQHSPV